MKMDTISKYQFDKQEVDFGDMIEQQFYNAEFIQVGDKKIKSVNASCGCTAVAQSGNSISVTYKPNKVTPMAKELQGYYDTVKTITVVFKDESMEKLTIKGKVYEQLSE